jgi:hypothetical protein
LRGTEYILGNWLAGWICFTAPLCAREMHVAATLFPLAPKVGFCLSFFLCFSVVLILKFLLF